MFFLYSLYYIFTFSNLQ